MTSKDNNLRQVGKRSKSLMARFRLAYERLNHAQRQSAQKSFCDLHSITPGTFRNKMNGFSTLFEAEVEWMESYNPYEQQSQVAQ